MDTKRADPPFDRVCSIGNALEAVQPGSTDLLLLLAGYATSSNLEARQNMLDETRDGDLPLEEAVKLRRRDILRRVAGLGLLLISGAQPEEREALLAPPSSSHDFLQEIANIHVGLFDGRNERTLTRLHILRGSLGVPRTRWAEFASIRTLRTTARASVEGRPSEYLGEAYGLASEAHVRVDTCWRISVRQSRWLTADTLLGELMVERSSAEARAADPAAYIRLAEGYESDTMKVIYEMREEFPAEAALLPTSATYALLGIPADRDAARRAIHMADGAVEQARWYSSLKVDNVDERQAQACALSMALEARARVGVHFPILLSAKGEQADADLKEAIQVADEAGFEALAHRAKLTGVLKTLKTYPGIKNDVSFQEYTRSLVKSAPTPRTQDKTKRVLAGVLDD